MKSLQGLSVPQEPRVGRQGDPRVSGDRGSRPTSNSAQSRVWDQSFWVSLSFLIFKMGARTPHSPDGPELQKH